MKTILFPTDFSMNSIHAIRYGLELFKNEKVDYILLNAYTDPSVGATMTYVWEDYMQDISQKMLASLLEKLQDDYGYEGLEAECVSQYGDLPGALTGVLKEKEVDLIIMGASGASSPNISIFGSNAYATMQRANCPVLTVPLQSTIKAPFRIGLASESKLIGDEAVLAPLREIADLHSSWVMGVNVNEQNISRTLTDEEESFFDDTPDIQYIDLSDASPLIGIETAIGRYRIEMLAIIIKKRTLLDRIFHKSVSKQIAKDVAIPILTLHEAL